MNRHPRVLLSAVSFNGNADGRAICDTFVEQLRLAHPDAEISVLLKYPKDDLQMCTAFGYKGYSFSTLYQLIVGGLFFVFGSVIKLLHLPHKWLTGHGTLRAFYDNDLLVDLNGISFCDDRSFSSLVINTLWFLPAFVSGIPCIKLAQSLGPYRKTSTRLAAQFVLPRMRAIVARGDRSYTLTKAFLENENVQLYNLPDIAFCLKPVAREEALSYVHQAGIQGDQYIVAGPSYVVDGLIDSHVYLSLFEKVLREWHAASGFPVLLVPHSRSHGKAIGVDSSNDDVLVCRQLMTMLTAASIPAFVLEQRLDAHILKGVIGGAEIAVASRYHFLIASMSSGVPSLALGWSHKYHDMFGLFDLDEYAFSCNAFAPDVIMCAAEEVFVKRADIRRQIESRLPDVQMQSAQNGALVCGIISEMRSHES